VKISILKRHRVWWTLTADNAQRHPTFDLALAHARHLITPDAPQSHIPAEHIAVRVSDLIAEAWTVDRIAVAAGVPTRVISDLASLTVGKLRSYRLDQVHAGRIVDLYRLEAVA